MSDERAPSAGAAFGAAAALAALAGALSLPGRPAGLNVFLTAVAVACAVTIAGPRPRTLEAIALAAAALAFAAAAIVRDATWVVAVDVCFAAGLALLSVTGASTWSAMGKEALHGVLRLPDGVRYALWPLLERAASRRWDVLRPVARGGLLGIVLLVVFGTLFLTADRAFAQIARDAVSVSVDLSLVPARVLVGLAVIAATGALALSGPRVDARVRTPALVHAVGAGATIGDRVGPESRRLGRAEWVTPLVLLDLLFAAFVAVQVAVLFGGERHVLETAGLTYAQYARGGFFQLCAVGAGALAVVAATARWGDRRSKVDDVLLRVLLGTLLALTLVVLVSALRRLTLYEMTYGYTRLRISVHATILWLAGVITLVMAAGVKLRATWLPRAVVAFTAAALMAFTFVNPDAVIARANVDRFDATQRIDLEYLSTLSADAAPALYALPGGLRDCALARLDRRLGDESWISYNAARDRARAVVDAATRDDVPCPVLP